MTPFSILLVGCGNMGNALLSRWREKCADDVRDIHIIDPRAADGIYPSLDALPTTAQVDVVVLAAKPQQLADILPAYRARFGADVLYVSIAAGKTLAFYAEHLGADAAVVRAMPNTPAMVGKGMTALCANSHVSDEQKERASLLMKAVGKTLWVEEAQMNAVTALSGSGPAYVFLFADALVKAGVSLGLTESDARMLALATLHGATHLAETSGENLTNLRQNVTSPGGTTEAALRVLMEGNVLEKLLEKALQEASNRAETLSK
jgi:pyrroline-5-carboxylate reductase